MLERKSFISSIEPTDDGPVQVRVGLQTILDGRVLETLWHRTVVEPGTSPDDQMAAVNAAIAKLETGPWPEIETKGMSALSAVCSVMHTSDVVQEFQAKRVAEVTAKEAASEIRLSARK